VAAIDAVTGTTKWVFGPAAYKLGMPTNIGWLHRGVAYWRDGTDERIVMLTGHAFMIALDAKTGRPIESFGDKGTVDLSQDLGRPIVARWHYGHTLPPVIVRDVIVVGSRRTRASPQSDCTYSPGNPSKRITGEAPASSSARSRATKR
jgi:quinoprotein glucose dehydrogenase